MASAKSSTRLFRTQKRLLKNKYTYPFTETSLSFTATSAAEVKYEATKTDPENSIVGVDEYFMTNSGLDKLGKKFYSI